MGDISKHFNRREFECKCGCGYDVVDIELISVLEDIREHFSNSVTITSGCRCDKHNAEVGGSQYSQHLCGKAADFKVRSVSPDMVAAYLLNRYPGKYGIGRYIGRTHVDVRKNKARWDLR